MTVVLDSGALIPLDRGERAMWIRLKAAQIIGDVPVTHAGVVAQVWRGSPRQVQLSRALEGIDVHAVDDRLGGAAGALLGTAGTSDVIDAAVVLLADDGDDIITSDVDDIARLASTMDLHIELLRP